ncbi:hypothetical protein ACOI1H_23215 [Loktanella sp. DJP18]|uniref:hypothetical protein n=1 Tax=Loktanella sp. DJP18 TaxID=3409788 RepID=UPI003BB6B8FA
MNGAEPALHLIAVDAVSATSSETIGIGMVLKSSQGETLKQAAATRSGTRKLGVVLAIAACIDTALAASTPGDTIEIITIFDRSPLLSNPDGAHSAAMAVALESFEQTLSRAMDAGVTIVMDKADAREMPCLAEATRQAAIGLLFIQEATAA